MSAQKYVIFDLDFTDLEKELDALKIRFDEEEPYEEF